MELSERERLILIEKKEEILKLTKEILEIMRDPKQKLEIEKKITSILSLVSTIASYAKPKGVNLQNLSEATNYLFMSMDASSLYMPTTSIQMFCNTTNGIRFDFTKRDIIIKIPKIDFSIFKSNK